jgi:predicted phage tail protein
MVSGATGYNVYRYTSSSVTNSTQINTGLVTGTSYTDSGRSASTTYYYWVSAVNGSGEGSKSSSYGSATTLAGASVLSAPTGVSATAQSSSSISITWNTVSGATGYNVYRYTSSSVAYATLINTITGISYTDTGLSASTTYYYWVSAVNGSGEGSKSSNYGSATTTSNSATTLTQGYWTTSTLTAGATITYQFYASAGTTYHIQWDDYYQGSGSYTCDIKVSASGAGITPFSGIDTAYATPRSVTASSSGYITITVQGFYAYSTGTYRIGYY